MLQSRLTFHIIVIFLKLTSRHYFPFPYFVERINTIELYLSEIARGKTIYIIEVHTVRVNQSSQSVFSIIFVHIVGAYIQSEFKQ